MSIALFIICFIITMIGAISGIGGGVIIRPLLEIITDMSPSAISFISSWAVFSMALMSILQSSHETIKIEKGRGTMIAIGSMCGGVLGKLIFEWAKTASGNEALVGKAQNLALLVTMGTILVVTLLKDRFTPRNYTNLFICMVYGIVLGMLSAFIGVGGGPINVFALSFFFAMETKKAAFHSIYIILFSQSAALVSTFLSGNTPAIPWTFPALASLGGVMGAIVGRKLAKRISAAVTEKLYLGVLVLVMLLTISNIIQ